MKSLFRIGGRLYPLTMLADRVLFTIRVWNLERRVRSVRRAIAK